MKSLVFLVLAVFAFSANAIITAPFSNSYDNAGTVVHQDKVFVSVKAPAAGLAIGNLVKVDLTADDGILVALAGTTQTQTPYCVVAETIGANAMGKCQVYGVGQVLLDATVVATAGELAYISGSTSGRAAGAAASSHYAPIGEWLDSSSTSGLTDIFIRGL